MAALSREDMVRSGFWPKLRKALAYAPFAEDAVAAWYCAFDANTPLRAKGILLAALAYFILPFDTIPDFILGLGFTDDAAVLLAAVGMIRKHLQPEHYDKARAALDRMKQGGEPAAQ